MKTKISLKARMRLFALLALVLCAVMAAGIVASAVPGRSFAADGEHEVVGGNYFLSDYDTVDDVAAEGREICSELVAEGTVLLKNVDNALPLQRGKISMFGKNLYQKMGGLTTAFMNAGFEVNPALSPFYNNNELSGPGAPGHPGNGVVVSGLPTGEADISRFEDTNNSVAEYNDAAIVAFYRTSGEGFDIPRTMMQVDGDYKKFGPGDPEPVTGARATDDHQLQLDANEAALLKYCAERFEKVIVLINSPAPMELGFLDDPDHYAYSDKIKGALWTNAFNSESWEPLVQIMTGEINPSGHLPDTFARDFKADPSWNNFGNNFMEDYTDGSLVYAKGNQYANDNMHGGGGNGGGGYYSNYVYYKEGIYSGYRYWETRGYTEGLDTPWTGTETDVLAHHAHGPNEAIHYYSKTGADASKQETLDDKKWNNWYDAHVVFPFGHGLSYTTFDWAFADDAEGGALDPDGKVSVSVTVTNTGEVAGKDVVQLYYNAPYTPGGIEKAHVKLGAFVKTKLLEPDESQTVTLSFGVRDMASYDWNDKNANGFKGYELDAGTYNIYVGSDAHCWADENVLTKSYTLSEGYKYETDEATGNKVENRFDAMSEQLLHEDRYPEDGENNEKDMYMTRADWGTTWPTLSYRLTAEQWIIDGLKEYNDVREAPFGWEYPEDKPTDPWYTDVMPTQGAVYETPIRLEELFGLEYDDPKWDEFLDQLTIDQLKELALRGGYKSGMNIPELGITQGFNADSPTCVLITGAQQNVWLPSDILTAATWNEDLAYRRGKILGEISLWGGGNVAARVPGWYAPAVNVHRNPFGGRVGEYLSEDGFLAGKISAQIVKGAQEKGMFCYVKHFAVNSQETNRCGLLTWADEQTMREIYFKPFEICVKEGKTLGIMSSLNRFGPRWAGGSYELLTEVLRDEWGFRGNVVTDSFAAWSNADIMIRAGGSLALGNGWLHVDPDCETPTTVNCLRNCAHDVLYAHANSMALNTGDTPTVPKKIRSFTAKTLEAGMVNDEYIASIADCVTLNTQYYPELDASKITFALSETSALPAGLKLSPDGTISGTPTLEARLSFTVVATYENETMSATFTITIVGEGGAIIYDPSDSALTAKVGSSFTADVDEAYIYDPYATADDVANFPDITYSLANGSLLPSGLTLSSDGTISGTPDKECRDYKFSVTAGAIGYSDTTFEYSISIYFDIVYSSAELARGSYGKTYTAFIGTAECEAPVTYALKSGSSLPAGLQLTAGGYITGKPTEACSVTFTVVASSAYADPVEATYSLKIDPTFDSATALPNAKTGVQYLGSVATAQGSFDVKYEVVGGMVPIGMTLSSDGTLSGTPGMPGLYTFTVRATDGDLSDDITLTLFVDQTSTATAATGSTGSNIHDAVVIVFIVITSVLVVGFAVTIVLLAKMRKKLK